MKRLVGIAIFAALASFFPKPSQASEWGCEVLLCAASSNPSWKGVESCHPPMEKLISEMEKPGFSWPTCPEGGAGKPGYERYADCPAGWMPGQNPDLARSGDQSQCIRKVDECNGRSNSRSPLNGNGDADIVTRVFTGRDNCMAIEFTQRPVRQDPYFFDMRDDTTKQMSRFWFNLSR